MSLPNKDAPLKVMIENFPQFSRTETGWEFTYDEEDMLRITANKVHIQGEICKTAGFSNEILIINDGSGKVKVTRSSQVPGDFSWINIGVYCSVIGTLLENGKLPHIGAIKIAKITNQVLKEMWPWEVRDLQNFMTGRILPKLPEDCFN